MKYCSSSGASCRYACLRRFMPDTQRASSRFAWTRRVYVPTPRKKTTGRSTSEKTLNASPNVDAWATSASATTLPDSADRNMLDRLNDSFQVSERVASRLQCSVARIWSRTATGRAVAESPVPGGISLATGGIGMRSIYIVAPVVSAASARPQSGDELVVQDTVARDDLEPVDPADAGEVRHPTARLLDEDERRGEVPCPDVDLDHSLGGALGKQRVAPEVAEAALAPRSLH